MFYVFSPKTNQGHALNSVAESGRAYLRVGRTENDSLCPPLSLSLSVCVSLCLSRSVHHGNSGRSVSEVKAGGTRGRGHTETDRGRKEGAVRKMAVTTSVTRSAKATSGRRASRAGRSGRAPKAAGRSHSVRPRQNTEWNVVCPGCRVRACVRACWAGRVP